MATRRFLVLAGALLVATVSLQGAAAGPVPAVYYLKDAQGGPALPGVLNIHGPPPLYVPPTDPVNYTGGPLQYSQDVAANMSKQSAQSRIITNGQDIVYPVQFIEDATDTNTARIWGPILVFLVLPKSPLVQHANVSIELVTLTGGTAPAYIDATTKVIASSEVSVDGGNVTPPDPTTFIPPDPSSPEGAAGYVGGQLLTYGITKLAEGYVLAYLDDKVKDKIVDATIPKDARLGLRLRLVIGSSTLPAPMAVGQTVVYNTTLTPDLVYVPWFVPDPPKPPAPPPAPVEHTPKSPPPAPATPPPSPAPGKKSPGLEMLGILAALGAAVAIGRRRAK